MTDETCRLLSALRVRLIAFSFHFCCRRGLVRIFSSWSTKWPFETIKARDAEFGKAKKDVLDKAKELVAERNRYRRERKQAIQTAEGLEEDLETAQTKIVRLEQEKVDEAEKMEQEMDRLRQSHLHEVMCVRDRATAAAAKFFKKFRKYMADRDKLEAKLFLHSQAFGTLESMDILESWGLQVPKKLRDLLAANEAQFKEEVDEIDVEDITEQDLTLSLPRSELLWNLDQFGSKLGTVDSATASALRSPILDGEKPIVTCEDHEGSQIKCWNRLSKLRLKVARLRSRIRRRQGPKGSGTLCSRIHLPKIGLEGLSGSYVVVVPII